MTTVSESLSPLPPPPSSIDETLEEAEFVRNSLTQCGFNINKKSVWKPQKELIWLGIKINLIHSRFTIPIDLILSIKESIQFTIKKLHTTAPNLSKLCGKIISNKFVLGNIAQLKAKNLHRLIQAELTWDRRIRYRKTTNQSGNYFFEK